jgi:hypothetical protein
MSDDESPPEKLYTREQVSEMTGMSLSNIRRREAEGKFKPKRGKLNQVFYNQEQIDILRESQIKGPRRHKSVYGASSALQVFELLKKDMELGEIVLTTGLHPTIVREIVKDYNELTGAIVINGQLMKIINKLPLDAVFPITRGDEVVEVLKAYAEDVCISCKRRPKHICKKCAIAIAQDTDI